MYQRLAFTVALASVIVGLLKAGSQVGPGPKASVAHRGASAYAPEHTLATPYTFTSRALATRFRDVLDEMRYYLFDLGVDAVFTDNPDRFPRNAGDR